MRAVKCLVYGRWQAPWTRLGDLSEWEMRPLLYIVVRTLTQSDDNENQLVVWIAMRMFEIEVHVVEDSTLHS